MAQTSVEYHRTIESTIGCIRIITDTQCTCTCTTTLLGHGHYPCTDFSRISCTRALHPLPRLPPPPPCGTLCPPLTLRECTHTPRITRHTLYTGVIAIFPPPNFTDHLHSNRVVFFSFLSHFRAPQNFIIY